MKDFSDTIPAELVKHVTEMCGRDGKQWLEALPESIAQLEAQWNIAVGAAFPAIEFNYVASTKKADGTLAVIKIAPPYESTEIFGEAKYLRTRKGVGCVDLLAEDNAARAILIERAVPGENLTEHFAGHELDAVAPAIAVLQEILLPAPADMKDVISLDDWFDGLKLHTSTAFPSGYARKALDLYKILSADENAQRYLHGDLHSGNIVTATRAPFLAIDPKGIVGHVGYEIAVFLNNLHWWQDDRPDIPERLTVAIDLFSAAFEIEALELRQWAFAQMVLSAWWTFDEMPRLYDNEVAKADIWNV